MCVFLIAVHLQHCPSVAGDHGSIEAPRDIIVHMPIFTFLVIRIRTMNMVSMTQTPVHWLHFPAMFLVYGQFSSFNNPRLDYRILYSTNLVPRKAPSNEMSQHCPSTLSLPCLLQDQPYDSNCELCNNNRESSPMSGARCAGVGWDIDARQCSGCDEAIPSSDGGRWGSI
jgi:hypothetical protein